METMGMANVAVLKPLALLEYEVVLGGQDFFVSLNGPCKPSECEGFSVDENGCFVLRQAVAEFVSLPIPDDYVELVAVSDEILFVQFAGGKVADAKALPRVVGSIGAAG